MPFTAPKKSRRHNKVQARIESRKGSPASTVSSTILIGPTGEWSHVQPFQCINALYDGVSRCLTCTRRTRSDTCRFKGIRTIHYHGEKVVGYELLDKGSQMVNPKFPKTWNVSLEKEHIDKIKLTSAVQLLPMLANELRHIEETGAKYRPRESKVRTTCDTCSTSIFSQAWFCLECGREVCVDCFATLVKFKDGLTGCYAEEFRAHTRRHPDFFNCTRITNTIHSSSDFKPTTRFQRRQLEEAIRDMKQFIQKIEPQVPLLMHSLPTMGTDGTIPSLPIPHCLVDELTEDVFSCVWAMGDPLLVIDAGRNFHTQNWTPGYFMNTYGDELCEVIDCRTGKKESTTVRDFFRLFGPKKHRKCLKLKDWPPQSDFAAKFPELSDDFNKGVPVPNYVRRDGVLNISSHFPKDFVPPDLGPKMYNAYGNPQQTGPDSEGSTKLHMDMADALNIMLHAEEQPDGKIGCAAWDIFRACDSTKLRTFLKWKFPGYSDTDPIHSQRLYLTDPLRAELYNKTQVKSYRVYQEAGQGVFIPAGCAHQVSNLSDCIKIAIDFVSPNNITRCAQLTAEFRKQNDTNGKSSKEDALALKSMMWFAWLSCCEQEKQRESHVYSM
ncbi:Clavaminate synthase-like protein [Mycena filopes]|nr:Clavaminate synthase-like protein [Mycena filopes]